MEQNGNSGRRKNMQVAVVGAGLVGSLNACFLAQRGFQVELYEYRDDIRLQEHVPGRSINLALSVRGQEALRGIGLEKEIIDNHGIPMHGRMIHSVDGQCRPIPYGEQGQCIYSVGRRYLNEILLTAAESHPNVKIHFGHKLVKSDLPTGKMTFQVGTNKEEIKSKVDLIIGTDGAFSVVRREMMKQPLFDFSQTYIPHGYMELCIPAGKDGKHAMEKNYLHIWPRGSFMMIALPNQDCTWTVTLFMPFEKFQSLNSEYALMAFFQENFPDSIPLIGRSKLLRDFIATRPSALVSIKCKPYNVGASALVMGDAAHAMVPFYGQGMNAGFEDCLIFNDFLDKYDNIGNVLSEFSSFRNPDAEAICDLAMYNYVEMRHLVNSKTFLIRKHIDNLLYRLFPNTWIPLYSMVTFSRIRYQECMRRRRWQNKVLKITIVPSSLLVITVSGIILAYKREQLTKMVHNLTNRICSLFQ